MGELYERHHLRLFRAAWRITGNEADAEDVLQTVFLRVLRMEEPLEPEAGAIAYLQRATVHAALDVLRRRKSAKADPFEANGHALADPEADAESGLAEREARERLRAALAALPERAAAMFALRHLEGCGNREIARITGASWGTVAVTLHRARKSLRAALAGGER